jgi:UrcA family protein
MSRILVAIAAAVSIAAASSPASAQVAGGYNDRQSYNFAISASDADLHARLRLAARQFCGERLGTVTMREYLMVRQCKREFISRAREGLDPTGGDT